MLTGFTKHMVRWYNDRFHIHHRDADAVHQLIFATTPLSDGHGGTEMLDAVVGYATEQRQANREFVAELGL